jgi:hypothetical protein
VRHFATGWDQRSDSACDGFPKRIPAGRVGVFLVFLVGLLAGPRVPAQDQPGKAKTASQKGAAASAVPLGRFVAKENLILYGQFDGLNNTATAWKASAAYRMLNETPLGGIMEQVTTQLLDKTLTLYPEHRLDGAQLVTLIEHAANSGFVLAIHANPKNSENPLRGTLVVRNAAGKDLRALSARAMGWIMGDAKAKPELRDGRTMVIVPPSAAAGSSTGSSPGWVWWAEKEDLVISFPGPSSADPIVAALDGKTPTVVEHPLALTLSKPEGSFQPVCIAFADTANCPAIPGRLTELLHTIGADWGVQRIDARLGFDGDSLMTVTRVTAPKPRKGPFALFDQPTFEASAVLPLPAGVDSFLALTLKPAQVLETLYATDTSDTIKNEVEELSKEIRRGGKIDIEKDLLAHLGPKITVFLAPERSAATNDESAESALKKGFNLLALTSVIQSALPKLTVVAEVDNPEHFGKALDAVVFAANRSLRARAHEMAEQERATAGDQAEGQDRPAGRPGTTQAGRAGSRTKRQRSAEETPAPHFASTGQQFAYVLTTPHDSPLKLGPSNFRPTIQLVGKHLVISTSGDAVKTALGALKQKEWKPSEEVQKACAELPKQLIALLVNDVRDGLSSTLASWPGTLQSTVNTAIALSRPKAAESGPAATPGEQLQPGRRASMAGRAPGRAVGASGVLGRAAMAGGPASEGERGGPPSPGNPGSPPGSSGSSGSTGDDMIQLNVDAAKLPKADDLKKLLSASTAFINLSDEEVRLTTRTAFPNLGLPIQLAPLLASTPLGQRIREAMVPAPGASADNSAAASGGSGPGATGAPPGGPAGAPPAAPPGRRRGGRRGGDE